ncbi:DUF3667 domain-containing protein [Altererythrobacter sp. GH1-8]|uniref:DUF3667 domain-containing protein n=1 Tax=Altererythrobacter sp. GH1-8 TaxID=3349333 RepID=UPI00374CC9EC
MSDITDGLGTAIEGSLAGRSVEPRQGETNPQTEALERVTCLNCSTSFTSPHCPQCGQKRDVPRSLTAIGHDIVHGVLHLDGKLWRTLPLLVFKPGNLTRRYIDGERAKFVSPMAMFLFSVFLMFAVFQMVGLTTPTDLTSDARAQVTQMVTAESEAIVTQIAEIDAELASSDLDAARREALLTQRASLATDLRLLETRGRNLSQWLISGDNSYVGELKSAGEDQIAEAKKRLKVLPEGSSEYTDLAAEIAAAERGLSELQKLEDQAQSTIPFLENSDGTIAATKTGVGLVDSLVEKWRSNPSLMLYKLQTNGYKFSWLLIPLSIPFVWLIFAWKRRFKAYDHAIFVTYSLSFMSLLFIAMSLVAASSIDQSGSYAFMIFATVAPLHVYKQLKYTYDLSRLSTLWRFLALLIFVLIVLLLFLQALLVLGAF